MSSLTPTQVSAAATEVLLSQGYTEVPPDIAPDKTVGSARFFEDAFGVVAVHVFGSWPSLLEQWPRAQGDLVDLMSSHLRLPEPKAWEGYLVLLTPDLLPTDSRVALTDLRGNTHRVRKLVAAGEDLLSLEDVRGALLPLLPLDVGESHETTGGVLDRLPALMAIEGVSPDVTRLVLEAFQSNASILERLHDAGGKG
jgi:hypothetical protein